MTNAMAAFGIAVAGTSLICIALMTRAERIKRSRSPGGCSTDGGPYLGDGWTVANWFGGHSLRDSSGNPGDFGGGHSLTDSSGNPVDFGGDFGGGGGDAGGGGSD